jgi:glutathione S-transferase
MGGCLDTKADIPFAGKCSSSSATTARSRYQRSIPDRTVPVLWIDREPVWIRWRSAKRSQSCFRKSCCGLGCDRERFARSISAEMHSGFATSARYMPMNIAVHIQAKGRNPASTRISRASYRSGNRAVPASAGGELLFGSFTCADAMCAPVRRTVRTYAVELPPVARRYADALIGLHSVQRWRAGALAENRIRPGPMSRQPQANKAEPSTLQPFRPEIFDTVVAFLSLLSAVVMLAQSLPSPHPPSRRRWPSRAASRHPADSTPEQLRQHNEQMDDAWQFYHAHRDEDDAGATPGARCGAAQPKPAQLLLLDVASFSISTGRPMTARRPPRHSSPSIPTPLIQTNFDQLFR